MTPLKINRQMIKLLNTSDLLTYTADRGANMAGNPYFPTPTPTVLAMKTLGQNFRDADSLARQVRSILNTQARQTALEALIAGHMDWITYIEETADLTLEMIQTSGYTPYKERSGAEVPPPAGKPSYLPTVNTGEIELKAPVYKQGKHKIFYNWQRSEDQGATWQNLPTTNNSHRRKVSNLALNMEYWFKVAYGTTAGEGQASEYISVVLTQDSRATTNIKTKTKTAELKATA